MVENYTKDIKESVYHGAVVSALAVGYTMLGKTLIKMSPPCAHSEFWGVASHVPSLQATLPLDIFSNFRYELSHPLPVFQKILTVSPLPK